jgi:hypothetical protein
MKSKEILPEEKRANIIRMFRECRVMHVKDVEVIFNSLLAAEAELSDEFAALKEVSELTRESNKGIQEVSKMLKNIVKLNDTSWTRCSELPPPQGIPVIGCDKKWIHPDFNPEGIREFFVDDVMGVVSAEWFDYHDTYRSSISQEVPEFWIPYPVTPK